MAALCSINFGHVPYLLLQRSGHNGHGRLASSSAFFCNSHTLPSDRIVACPQPVSACRRSQKLIRQSSRKNTADEVPAEGGAEAQVREEIGVAGCDESEVGESADQSVEVVVHFTEAEGGVIGGDQVGRVVG